MPSLAIATAAVKRAKEKLDDAQTAGRVRQEIIAISAPRAITVNPINPVDVALALVHRRTVISPIPVSCCATAHRVASALEDSAAICARNATTDIMAIPLRAFPVSRVSVTSTEVSATSVTN